MKLKIIALALALAWTGSAAIAKPNREGWEYWPALLPADKTTNVEQTPEQLKRLAAKAIVEIFTITNQGDIWTGTGFFIDEDHLITNYHMIRNLKRIAFKSDYARLNKDGTVKHIKNIAFKFIDGRVIYGADILFSNPKCDLALLLVDGKSTGWLSLASDSSNLILKQKVAVIGFPDARAAYSEGVINELLWDHSGSMIAGFKLSAYGNHGQSGSPVLDAYGKVIGVVFAGNDTTHQPTALSANFVWEALKLLSFDHEGEFHTGVTQGVDLRTDSDAQFDDSI